MKHLPYDRSERVADAIYQIVASAIRNGLADPRLRGVEVTQVRMTRDLRTARIYYHMNDAADEKQNAVAKGLASSAGYLKKRIGEEIKLKFMPDIVFFYDETIDVKERIEELLKGETSGGRSRTREEKG